MAVQTPSKTDSERLDDLESRMAIMEEHMSVMQGNVAWIVEFFSPDDEGTDRISRLESKIDRILEKI